MVKRSPSAVKREGIVTESSSERGLATPTRSRSFTTYDELMRNEDQARRAIRTEESLAELRAVPSMSKDARTVNKWFHSKDSMADLGQIPSLCGEEKKTPTVNKWLHSKSSMVDLKEVPELGHRDNDYDLKPEICNSDYAYYPPVLRNSEYQVKVTLTPTNSSYCYSNLHPSESVERQPNYQPVTPNNGTVNKRLRSVVSEADVARLEISCTERVMAVNSAECLNKRMLSADSQYDLNQLTPIYDLGRQVLRDFSRQSMEDLRLLPTISSYNLRHEDHPTESVCTARSIGSFDQQPEEGVCTARSIRSRSKLSYFPEALRRL